MISMVRSGVVAASMLFAAMSISIADPAYLWRPSDNEIIWPEVDVKQLMKPKSRVTPPGNEIIWPEVDVKQLMARVMSRITPPPQEFDHGYTGTLTIVRFGEQKPCPLRALACTKVIDKNCTVFIPDDKTLEWLDLADQFEFIYRHERAHCNGWHHEQPWD